LERGLLHIGDSRRADSKTGTSENPKTWKNGVLKTKGEATPKKKNRREGQWPKPQALSHQKESGTA